MHKILFKSNASDLSKILSYLETLQKNTLYLTYRIDSILKKVNELATDKGLQKQVDQYFEDDDIASDSGTNQEDSQTSPQTDSEKQ